MCNSSRKMTAEAPITRLTIARNAINQPKIRVYLDQPGNRPQRSGFLRRVNSRLAGALSFLLPDAWQNKNSQGEENEGQQSNQRDGGPKLARASWGGRITVVERGAKRV